MSIRILSLPFFCFLTVIQTAPPTWGLDIWEPNDSLADVQKLDIDTVHEIFTYASIDSPTDEDWFHLTHLAIADKWVTAWIEDRPGGQEGTGFDTVLEMLNGATGASIASNDDISSQIRQSGIIGAAVPMDASPTFRVRPFGADDLGPYRLYTMIHLQGGGRDRVEVEPNDTSGSSDGISSGQNMSGVISDATDVDWFEFVTPLPHEAEFAVALRNDSGGGADFVVEVLDESGNVNYLPRLNDDGETGANDFLVFSVGDVQEKTRKIRVSSRSGTGAYRLFLGELNPSNQEWFRSPSLLNLSIPDNDISGVTDIITVPDSAVVENLNVRVNIEHSDLEDLRLELTHIDSGRTVTLYNANCPGATLTVSFDEESVFGFCPLAFGGHAPPVDSFAPFLDEDIKGDWALNVIDGDGGDTGTLRNWSLEMEASSKYVPPPFTCNSPYTGPMSGAISIKDSTGQGLAFTEDTIIITDPGTLADLNVFVDISHDDIADIGFTIQNVESGLSVPLYTGLTCNETRVMAVFDDEGAAAPCPPVDPMTPIMPNASGAGLDAFEGRPLAGTWILRVNDANPGTTGTLNQWCLLPTLQTVTDTPTSTPTETPTPTTDVGFNCTSSYSGPMAGPATIPDATPLGVGTLQDTIVIADPGTLSDMDVFVDITHDAIADLGVSLVRQEDALVIPLYSGIACSATRLSAVFSDEGGAAPCPAIDPFTPIQPNTGTTSLDDLENRSLAGTWTLQVVDGSQGATGVLNSWCLIPTLQGPTN
ncbi:MAG: proprotein convertase P-domain-containing protein, partial [Candidatus Omnitrophica bacterium]|nr:proprotein convertase P-domain-containing protein [Candidatus Omnitrophota bacterium]